MLHNLYEKNIKLIQYSFFGGLGVLSDISIYSFLIYLNINYQFANASGYLVGTIISFFLNRHYTFKLKDKILSRILKFFSVAFAGYLVSVLLLYIFIENLMIDEIISKLLTLFFVLIIQFTLNKKFTFKESK
jgi:putative flippase GtrA